MTGPRLTTVHELRALIVRQDWAALTDALVTYCVHVGTNPPVVLRALTDDERSLAMRALLAEVYVSTTVH